MGFGDAAACFAEQPTVAYRVKRTFVTAGEEPAAKAKRGASCPPDVLRMRHPLTVVMLANLPNKAKAEKVRAHVAKLQVEATDISMAFDRRTGVNRGYAFLKFPDEEAAAEFIAKVEGTQVEGSKSKKQLTASYANRLYKVKPLRLLSSQKKSQKKWDH